MSNYRKNNPIHVIPSNPIHVTPRPHVGPGTLRGKGLNQVCIPPSRYPGSGLRGNCQPGLVCKMIEGGDSGVPVCRPPPHRPSPGQPSPTPHHRHSIPTQYRGCVVGDRNNNCGKNNYCKPLSSRSSKLGGRGLCTTIPTPIPIVVPSGVGGRCNYSTHPQQPCKSNLVCNAGPGVGGDGTCVIPGRVHPHQRPVPVVVPSGVGGRCNYSTHPQQPCKSNLVCNAGPGVGGCVE